MTTMMMMMMNDDLCQKSRVKLIFQGTYCRLSRTGIVECLKIIDVGCNLKQFDVQASQKCIIHFWPKMHYSFSAVNENVDENDIPFSAEKQKQVICGYITEFSYGSLANITFSAQRKCHFWNENKNKTKMKIQFRPKMEKPKMTK